MVPEAELEVSVRTCCCGGDCPSADCTTVRSDCASVGLRPFHVNVGIAMRKATCDRYESDLIHCENDRCATWGSVPCGGCSPCNQSLVPPCPCKTGTCYLRDGRWVPALQCLYDSPVSTTETCKYGHPDYWYLTFLPTGTEPCEVPTSVYAPCASLGSVSCAFDLVYVEAGYSEVECANLSGQANGLHVTQLANCYAPGFTGLPFPTNYAHIGWPWDCDTNPIVPCGLPPENSCMCVCNKVFPTWLLGSSINKDCQLENALYARIEWAVPCAAGDDYGGIFACGDQCPCDDEEYSYVAVRYFGQSHAFGASVIGDPSYPIIDQDDPISVANACQPLVGDPLSTPPGSDCSAFGQAAGVFTCYDQCCTCTYDHTIIFRKSRAGMPNGTQCRLAPGAYEVAGYGPCGELNMGSCVNKPCAFRSQCVGSDLEWRNELERIGLQNILFEVYYP